MNNHDHLPNAPDVAGRRLMTTREYRQVMGYPSQMKMWRDEQRGVGPKPVRINGRRFWLADEVHDYIKRLAANRREAADPASDDEAVDEKAGRSDDEKSWLTKRLTDP